MMFRLVFYKAEFVVNARYITRLTATKYSVPITSYPFVGGVSDK
jgi:hypothetical protein